MANLSRVSTATEADWSFVGTPEIERALASAVRRVAREFALVEAEDARQDALLWLAVRPERVEQAHASGDYAQLGQDIYANGLRPAAVRESDRAMRMASLDFLTEEALLA